MPKWKSAGKKPAHFSTKVTPHLKWRAVLAWPGRLLIAGRVRGNRVARARWPAKVRRKPKLTGEQTQQVTEALLAGPAAQGYKTDLWTLPRVAALIEDLTGVRYHPGHVWRLMGASGFSCQRPERRAVERDEKAIRRWQRVGWPALKKKRASKDEPSFS
jgi:transposase